MDDYKNTNQLRYFVEENDLRAYNGIIDFTAIVTIRTIENLIKNVKVSVMINFDGYNNLGTVTIYKSDIDPYLFPTKFELIYNDLIIKNNPDGFLSISGTHKMNPKIDNYEVKITPLEKI